MDAYIEKYNYVKATDEDHDHLKDDIRENDDEWAEKINLEKLKKYFAALTKKLCVKGYPICYSPGYDMASTTIDCLDSIMREGLENRKLKIGDCHHLVFNLLVNCVKIGPGSSHCKLIPDILSMGDIDFQDYVRGLKGAQLMPLIKALKDFSYTPETCDDLSDSDQADGWETCTGKLLSLIRGDDLDKLKADQELLGEILDLGIFYLHKMSDMPESYIGELERCVNTVQDRENLYKLVTDNGVIKKNLASMRKLILHKSFPANETQQKEAKHIVTEIIVASKNKNVIVEMWDAINDFLKTLVLDENAEKYLEIIDDFRHSYIRIEKETFKKHPDMVKKWCPIFTEMLDKGKTKVVGVFAGQIIDHIQGICTPEKGDITIWMPLFKALLKHVKLDLVKIVASTLENSAFKKIWEWKKNWKEGQALIQQIAKIKIDPDAIEDDLSYVTNAYAKIVTSILEQFGILKIAENVAVDVVELYISIMELGSEEFNSIPKELSYNLPSLKNHKDKIPKLVKRFEVMFLNTKYPWTNRYTDGAAEGFVNMILDSLKDGGSKMDSAVTKSFINMFRRCLEEDVEYVEIEYGNATIYSILIRYPFSKFVEMHCKSDSKEVVKSLVPLIVKMMDMEDEDEIQDRAADMISTLAESQTEVLENHFPKLIEWYRKTQSYTFLGALSNMYKNLNTKSMKDSFQDLFAACLEDPSNIVMQVMMLSEVAKKIPEAFTKDNVTELLNVFIQQQNLSMMVLIMVDEIAMTSPENVPVDLFIQQIFQELTLEEYCTHYITKLAVTMALAYKSHADQIMEELFKLYQKCTNYMYTVVFINGMRSIAEKYGKEKLNPYREHFEDMKENGRTADEKTAAADLIDFLEGRSLAKVSDDVEVQKKDIKVLDKKVTDTKKTVAVVKTQVKKQELDITNVKKGVKDVNKRVDVVETDLDETKVKVEEIDNKTMTNAPAWSRDVTKLMNPKAEHDWRLLASRLGYSNKDIKGWATQHDPCMAVLSEWYATHKTVEASHAVLTALQEMNRMDAAAIVENAMKNVEGIVEEAPDYATPPPIFLSYQWGHQNEVKLLRNHLQMAGYECWMDIGQMGGGDKLFEKIDNGIRGAKLIICCVSEKYAKSPNCNREVNLSVNLGKPMIPLLMEKMGWPPKGSMGPIFSEYLFVRFFQRAGEETKDDRYWPVPKFQELLMQINLEVPPDNALVTKDYKEWWKPMAEEIIIVKKVDKGQGSQPQKSSEKEEDLSPDVFISYQWGKQPQIKQLYRRLTELGFSCWMDIYQMGGGDSLYDKIDRGVRGCKIILSCVTTKYSLSANCRREVSLADAIKKPIIPLLLEKIDWPPTGPMSMVFAQLLFINFYRDETVQMSWKGEKFDELLDKMKENVPAICFDDGSTKSKATDDAKTEPKDKEAKAEQPKQNQNKKPATAASSQKAKPNEDQEDSSSNSKPKSQGKTAKTPPKANDTTKPTQTQKSSKLTPKPKDTPIKTPNSEVTAKPEDAPKSEETSKPTATPSSKLTPNPKDTPIKTPNSKVTSKPEEAPKSEEKTKEITEQTSKETPTPQEKTTNSAEPNQKSSSCILI